MRIGIVTGEYPPDQGGVGDFTSQLARALAELGHHVHVITTSSHAAYGATQTPRLTVHRVLEGWGWRCWRQVLALARQVRLEIVDVQYQAAAFAMHPAINAIPRGDARPPVVATFHDLKVPYLFPKAGPLRQRVVWMLARRADGVIVTNREDEMKLADLTPPVSHLTRIPIGSNVFPSPPAGFRREAERARWMVGPDDMLLGYFGFLNESKGAEELIEALGLMVRREQPTHLLMVGGRVGTSDPTNRAYAEKVQRLIADLGLGERVHWTGYASSEDVSAALLATDLCVLPYRDGVSFRRGTLLACLAHERAIVTTWPTVALPEVQNKENMLLVEPRNPEGLARAVAEVSADADLRIRLERGAKALAAQFSWKNIARRTAAFFDTLVAGAR
jgi:glycosyltransferase involved in cell wall biosynthesis